MRARDVSCCVVWLSRRQRGTQRGRELYKELSRGHRVKFFCNNDFNGICRVIFETFRKPLGRCISKDDELTDVFVKIMFFVVVLPFRCVFFRKPLLESGTLGTKCNVQVTRKKCGTKADNEKCDR